MDSPRKRWVLQWLLEVAAAVALSGAAAAISQWLVGYGDSRGSQIFLLPVILCGALGGLRSAFTTAVVSFIVYLWIVIPPATSLEIKSLADALDALTFGLSALASGLASGYLRDQNRRVAGRSRIVLAVIEANRFLAATPNEHAIALQLIEHLKGFTGAPAWLCDGDGRVVAGDLTGLSAAQVETIRLLARASTRTSRRRSLSRGRLRARAIRVGERVLGVAAWTNASRGLRSQRELDEHIEILIEFTAAALLRQLSSGAVHARGSVAMPHADRPEDAGR